MVSFHCRMAGVSPASRSHIVIRGKNTTAPSQNTLLSADFETLLTNGLLKALTTMERTSWQTERIHGLNQRTLQRHLIEKSISKDLKGLERTLGTLLDRYLMFSRLVNSEGSFEREEKKSYRKYKSVSLFNKHSTVEDLEKCGENEVWTSLGRQKLDRYRRSPVSRHSIQSYCNRRTEPMHVNVQVSHSVKVTVNGHCYSASHLLHVLTNMLVWRWFLIQTNLGAAKMKLNEQGR